MHIIIWCYSLHLVIYDRRKIKFYNFSQLYLKIEIETDICAPGDSWFTTESNLDLDSRRHTFRVIIQWVCGVKADVMIYGYHWTTFTDAIIPIVMQLLLLTPYEIVEWRHIVWLTVILEGMWTRVSHHNCADSELPSSFGLIFTSFARAPT